MSVSGKLIFKRDFDKTYRQNIADLTAKGNWYLYNSFSFVITAFVNGQPTGKIEGNPTGDNFGYCIVCGTYITNHYSIKDTKTGTVLNVGCECIKKFLGESKGARIKKGIDSLRTKVKSQYLRPFKHDLLSNWLKSVAEKEEPDKIRGPKRLHKLKDYWMGQVRDGMRSLDKDKACCDYLGNESIDPCYNTLVHQWEETKIGDNGLIFGEWKSDKFFWLYHSKTFPRKDWNPDNMKNQYKHQAEKYGTELPPKWSEIKLTEEQQKEMNELIIDKINKYLDEFKSKR